MLIRDFTEKMKAMGEISLYTIAFSINDNFLQFAS